MCVKHVSGLFHLYDKSILAVSLFKRNSQTETFRLAVVTDVTGSRWAMNSKD